MNQSLLVLAGALVLTVLCALGIVIAVLRTRRPEEGIREWVREANGAWKREELAADTSAPGDLTLNQLVAAAHPADETLRDLVLREPQAPATAPIPPSYTPPRHRQRLASVASLQGAAADEEAAGDAAATVATETPAGDAGEDAAHTRAQAEAEDVPGAAIPAEAETLTEEAAAHADDVTPGADPATAGDTTDASSDPEPADEADACEATGDPTEPAGEADTHHATSPEEAAEV